MLELQLAMAVEVRRSNLTPAEQRARLTASMQVLLEAIDCLYCEYDLRAELDERKRMLETELEA